MIRFVYWKAEDYIGFPESENTWSGGTPDTPPWPFRPPRETPPWNPAAPGIGRRRIMDEAAAPQFDPIRHSRGGRPRKRPDERRGQPVTVWMTSAEVARLDEAVIAAHAVSRGDYLRA